MASQSKPYVLRWGIISTGGIATNFSKDLLVDPSSREAGDVKHKIVAVGSRSTESAEAFIQKLKESKDDSQWGVENGVLDGVKGYGSYEEVYNDPNVDAIYVGTPHTYHHANAKAAMLAGKNVLCEKPITFDMEELDELISIAKEKNVFFMEAVWTRFQPIAYEVQKVIHSGSLGKVNAFFADNCVNIHPDTVPDSSRMIDPKLGGGAVLDLGPYPSVWAMLVMHRHPDNKGATPKLVNSTQRVYPRTGVDANSRWRVHWDSVGQADMSAGIDSMSLKHVVVAVQCEEGDLTIEWPLWRPTAYWIHPHPNGQGGSVKESKRFEVTPHPGGGMHYEADEVARCIRDGKKESERMPWEESRIVQGWFDEIRKNGDTVLKDVKGTAGK